jgi:HPt (histidine-containing phosphotransfer) domain-containing protein
MSNAGARNMEKNELTLYLPAETHSPQIEAIDTGVLAKLRRDCDSGEVTFSDELLALYLDELEPRLNAIRRAVEHRECKALAVAAHALKGSSALVGARLLTELCLRMERAGRAGNVDMVRALMADLEREAVRVRQALTEARRNHGRQ